MSTMFKKTIGFVSIVLVVLWFHSMASAFVMHGRHLLELMTQKLGQAETLFITQKVTFYRVEVPPSTTATETENEARADTTADTAAETLAEKDLAPDVTKPEAIEPDVIEMAESLRYLISKAFRSEIVTDDNQRIHIFANGDALTIIDGVVRTTPQTRFDLYKDILLFRSRPELVDRLMYLNVDVSVTSLGRFEGQIAYVIGAQYPDESVDQLWVDQATFRPLRWIIADGASGFQPNPLEVRYHDWWQLNDTFWYPMRIEFYQNNQLVREIKVQRYEVDRSFSNDLFDIQQLRSTYPHAAQALSSDSEAESISEVQRTIEEFSKMFE